MHPLTDTCWKLFVNRTDGMLRARGCRWYFDPAELQPRHVSDALLWRYPLGVYAVDADGLARWLCLDADTPEGREGLVWIARTFAPDTYLFESSRRGAHLWRFCPPTRWNEVRGYGQWLVEQTGIACEVFPKGGGWNGVRMPLSIHPKSGSRYPIVDPETGESLPAGKLRQLRPTRLPLVSLAREAAPVQPAGQTGDIQTDFEALFAAIAQVTRIRRYGRDRAIGHCPFHDDQHPSLSVVGGFWRCWAGCGEGGLNAFRARARERHLV